MNIFKEKVKYNKVLWKELVMGVIMAFVWCSILFLIIYGYSEEIINILNFMTDNGEHFWVLYFLLLAIFIVIAVILKLLFFVLRIDVAEEAKAPRKVAHKTTAKKAVAKKTTKKRTTKK